MTVSERHLKHYGEHAKEFPAPHKDRGASRISVGLPIKLGPKTRVCVFPTLDRAPNKSETAVFMTDRDYPNMEAIYNGDDAVFLREAVGDLVLFEGSSMYHGRARPVRSIVPAMTVGPLDYCVCTNKGFLPSAACEKVKRSR